jgi:hypothetical protein
MFRASIVVSLIVAAVSVTAFAGKRERDMMTKEGAPAVKEAAASYSNSCGCAIAIGVADDLLDSQDSIREVIHMAKNIASNVPKYCTDGPSRKAMCQMKTLKFAKGPASFTFKDGYGVARTNGQEYTPFEMITRVLDK